MVWQCLFELQTAITMGRSCKVDIILTAEQLRLFKLFVQRNGYGSVDSILLNKIKSENAESSQKADLFSIQKLIESTIGYDRLDGMIRKRLRQWQEEEAGAIKSSGRSEMIAAGGANKLKSDDDESSAVQMVHSYINTTLYVNAHNTTDEEIASVRHMSVPSESPPRSPTVIMVADHSDDSEEVGGGDNVSVVHSAGPVGRLNLSESLSHGSWPKNAFHTSSLPTAPDLVPRNIPSPVSSGSTTSDKKSAAVSDDVRASKLAQGPARSNPLPSFERVHKVATVSDDVLTSRLASARLQSQRAPPSRVPRTSSGTIQTASPKPGGPFTRSGSTVSDDVLVYRRSKRSEVPESSTSPRHIYRGAGGDRSSSPLTPSPRSAGRTSRPRDVPGKSGSMVSVGSVGSAGTGGRHFGKHQGDSLSGKGHADAANTADHASKTLPRRLRSVESDSAASGVGILSPGSGSNFAHSEPDSPVLLSKPLSNRRVPNMHATLPVCLPDDLPRQPQPMESQPTDTQDRDRKPVTAKVIHAESSAHHTALDMSSVTATRGESSSLITRPPMGETNTNLQGNHSDHQARRMSFAQAMKQDRGTLSHSAAIARGRSNIRRSSQGKILPGYASESAASGDAPLSPAIELAVDHLPEEAMMVVHDAQPGKTAPKRSTGAWMAMLVSLRPKPSSKLPRPAQSQRPPADPNPRRPQQSNLPRPTSASKPNAKAKSARQFSLLRKFSASPKASPKVKRAKKGKQGADKQSRQPEAANVDSSPATDGFVNWEPLEQRGLEWDPPRIAVPTATARFSTGIVSSSNPKPAEVRGNGGVQETLV